LRSFLTAADAKIIKAGLNRNVALFSKDIAVPLSAGPRRHGRLCSASRDLSAGQFASAGALGRDNMILHQASAGQRLSAGRTMPRAVLDRDPTRAATAEATAPRSKLRWSATLQVVDPKRMPERRGCDGRVEDAANYTSLGMGLKSRRRDAGKPRETVNSSARLGLTPATPIRSPASRSTFGRRGCRFTQVSMRRFRRSCSRAAAILGDALRPADVMVFGRFNALFQSFGARDLARLDRGLTLPTPSSNATYCVVAGALLAYVWAQS